jgi:hypothetical protein
MHDFLFLKLGKKFSKLSYSEIMYAEAVKKYVRIVTPKKVHLILASMCLVEKVLPSNQFCRIHRSYIISLYHMTDFDSDVVYIGNKIFPIGKQHKGILQERVIILSSDTRMDFNEAEHDVSSIIGNINDQKIIS